MEKHFLRLSFKKKLMIYLLLISLIPTIIIGCFSYAASYKSALENYGNSLHFALKTLNDSSADTFARFRTNCIRMLLDDDFIQIFNSPYFYEEEGSLTGAVYKSDLHTYGYSIDFFTIDGKVVSISGSSGSTPNTSAETSRYLRQCDSNTQRHFGIPYPYGNDYLIPYICPVKTFSNGTDQGELVGVMVINLSETETERQIRDFFKNQNMTFALDDVMLAGKNDIIYSAYDNGLIGKSIPDTLQDRGKSGQRYFNIQNDGLHFNIVGSVSMKEVTVTADTILLTAAIIVLSLVILCIILSILISASVSRPVIRLANAADTIHKLETLDLDLVINEKADDEISRLEKSFKSMFVRLQKSLRDSQETHKQYLSAEYKALISQINPHFLYNTFSSVIYLIENNQKEESIEMLTALSDLFRSNIKNNKYFTSVKEEIEYTKNYLTIQKMRYRNFDFIIDVGIDLLDKFMIKLSLQPLVENAIYHGLRKRETKGLIIINGFIDRDRLVFEVKDNANTTAQESLDEINAYLTNMPADRKEHGIGLENVNSRIKIHFGREYGVYLYVKDNYTISHMEIPIQFSEEELHDEV